MRVGSIGARDSPAWLSVPGSACTGTNPTGFRPIRKPLPGLRYRRGFSRLIYRSAVYYPRVRLHQREGRVFIPLQSSLLLHFHPSRSFPQHQYPRRSFGDTETRKSAWKTLKRIYRARDTKRSWAEVQASARKRKKSNELTGAMECYCCEGGRVENKSERVGERGECWEYEGEKQCTRQLDRENYAKQKNLLCAG